MSLPLRAAVVTCVVIGQLRVFTLQRCVQGKPRHPVVGAIPWATQFVVLLSQGFFLSLKACDHIFKLSLSPLIVLLVDEPIRALLFVLEIKLATLLLHIFRLAIQISDARLVRLLLCCNLLLEICDTLGSLCFNLFQFCG